MPLEGPSPKPGDLIEFDRSLYQHWALYVGEEKVVHLTTNLGMSSLSLPFGNTAVVREDPIDLVADGRIYRVNNKYDKEMDPYPPDKIVEAARREVGKKMSYSVFKANCEHFVTELRYGKGFSDQVPFFMRSEKHSFDIWSEREKASMLESRHVRKDLVPLSKVPSFIRSQDDLFDRKQEIHLLIRTSGRVDTLQIFLSDKEIGAVYAVWIA